MLGGTHDGGIWEDLDGEEGAYDHILLCYNKIISNSQNEEN